MINQINKILQKNFPQNIIVRKPFLGTLLFAIFLFLFLLLYKPLDVRGARNFNFIVTMLLYQSLVYVPLVITALLIKRTNCFSKDKIWTFSKEIKSVGIFLLVFAISIYLEGFLIEEPSQRWNLPTIADAFSRAFLIGIVPFLIFTIANIRYLYTADAVQEFKPEREISKGESHEELIEIVSQLKKEELKFYPRQLIYAESEGNYVVFHLEVLEKHQTTVIRNSISNIEQQLSMVPFFMRTHRAFIVNVKKVTSTKGNSLGYRLKLEGINEEIPVSRQNTQKFDEIIRRYR